MYNRMDTSNSLFMVLPVCARKLPPMSYDTPVTTKYWDDDGTDEFSQMIATGGYRLRPAGRPGRVRRRSGSGSKQVRFGGESVSRATR